MDIVDFKEREERTDPGKKQKKPVKWFISADLYVERPSQKGILIGKGGSMLKEIGAAARKDIESFLEHPVFLDLHVKVKEKWRLDSRMAAADWLKLNDEELSDRTDDCCWGVARGTIGTVAGTGGRSIL